MKSAKANRERQALPSERSVMEVTPSEGIWGARVPGGRGKVQDDIQPWRTNETLYFLSNFYIFSTEFHPFGGGRLNNMI